MGARLLRDRILRPLVELERIQDRLDAVEELAFRAVDRGRLRETLGGVQDLDRILRQPGCVQTLAHRGGDCLVGVKRF